ncbi:M16 family metallopeptidase [Pedobacter heparinus]|uniref:Peptidase M16 domain protein n=1 Tax=Pedobacter heparinus (strain ATCC 13125 / DSM 2366 / CIP 104194 / JCM 7457 / NBRC 12017 / NCIMB 9290 / NRRL B-14731 / HIM 762-3) TaxID=485917 RepID=C6XTC9_PEDHD|nr:M16 family metallopeptidase [Pedobacter heparinus]ACU05707.1 peptidase M16 domain protein [Pedobacter heparinus DSM 2366]
MKHKLLLLVCLLITGTSLMAQSTYQWKTASSGGYTYKYVTNDPTKSRFYTLKNGLTVVLSPNPKEPIIEFRLAVRAGSNTDPRTATGLAHYLEHLLFKGTDKFGTMDFVKEKPLLDKIDALYEQYHETTDPAKRKEIYAQIDKTSGEASNYAIANEYDKMMKAIGGQSTNAHTWYEETVYNEDFPSNATDQFLALQAERFRNPIFRIFHTELEAVYEEKNRGLDNDGWKVNEQTGALLFPTHNYGQQTTIGTVEHLKNPSLLEIRKYYNKYYVPNNMVIALAGDLNPDEMIKKVDKAFAYMKAKPFELYNPAPEKPLTQVQKIDIYGPSAESVRMSYRGYAQNTTQSMLLDLISSILSNGKAGLLDINLNKQQKVLSSSAGYQQMKDYGIFTLIAQPKQGQSLEEAQKLLLQQLDILKKGDFDESLIKATVANSKLGLLEAFDKNSFRVESVTNEFILNRAENWDKSLNALDAMAKITKKQVIDFANQFFKDNYVIAFKHKGEDKSIQKVEKPVITPVNTNAGETSEFTKNLLAMQVKPIAPKFLDYKKDLNFGKAGIADVIAVQNKDNSIFNLTYRFDIGAWNYRLQPYAASYLAFLSTDKYTAEEISKQFYNIACSYSFNVSNEVASINISGLQENFDQAVSLVEHIFANCKPNEQALTELKSRILKSRENNKLNKASILSGLTTYAQYGASNPFNYTLSNEEIKNITSDQLVYILHNINNYKHTITYYGPQTLAAFTAGISKLHNLPKEFTPEAPAKKFSYAAENGNKVYFADYDMVQSEIRWVRNGGPYNQAWAPKINLFNSYFGGGMGSVVFQTIRESKALAYSTFAVFSSPDKKEKNYTMVAYVGSQADKMNDAVKGMNELLNTLPRTDKAFDASRYNALNAIETSRITKNDIIGAYFSDKKLGFDHDSRMDVYQGLKPLTFGDIKTFHENNVANKAYNYCIVASEKNVKMEDLQKFGTVTKLSLEQIFGY